MIFHQIAMLAVVALGASEITVQPGRGDRALASWQRSIGSLDRPGERTVETLKRYDLETRYRRDPDRAIAALERAAREQPQSDLVFALAELSWIDGRRLDRHRRPGALDRYLDTVAFAFDFLFDPDPALVAGRQPSDPRYRLACDLYNGGLDRLIHAAQGAGQGKILPGATVRLKIHRGEQVLRVALKDGPWEATDVDEILLASEFEVSGLDSRSPHYGLGVPLIGVRRPREAAKGAERFYPPELAFPLTAFLAPNSRLRDAEGGKPRECTLNLVDPVQSPFAIQGEASVPLEADLTTPLAYMWSRTDLDSYRWKGLLRPGDALGRAGLMLIRPYEPGKIPVVMVHGLWSTPLAWIPMLNELQRDPAIRTRYQFLLYLYPTGAPVPIAASGLRDALLLAERTLNPTRQDPNFERMVVVGHSMGGLLSHAMAVNSGNRLWELNSEISFKDLQGPPEVLSELRHYLFFDALPFVRRVVFLATPHRGSEHSRRTVGRIGAGLIVEPDKLSALLGQLIKANPDTLDRRQFRHLPTSIETLRIDSSELTAFLAMKPGDAGVKFHSIIGALRPGPIAETTDGVVSYRSSHLEGVESERVVRSDHGVQKAPEAILEVRRILLEHVGLSAARAATPAPRRE